MTERAGRARKVICFWLGDQQFGAEITQIKETIVLRPITRVFLVPRWVAGLVNLRGEVVAVLDLAEFLGIGATAFTADTRIVIARVRGRTAGLLVDRLAEARVVDLDALQPPPAALADADLVFGLTTLEDASPLVVLDLERLFDSDRLRQFRRRA